MSPLTDARAAAPAIEVSSFSEASVELPAVAGATGRAARGAQALARRVVLAGAILTAIYALAGPAEQLQLQVPLGAAGLRANAAGLVAAVAFLLAFALRLYRTVNRPERRWYGGRGLAEEIKSLAWRYAVGGASFDARQSPAETADEAEMADRFGATLHAFLRRARLQRLPLPPPPPDAEDALPYITGWMARVRAAPLAERRAIYAEHRIRNQQRFYLRRARAFARRAAGWNVGLLATEILFAILAALRALALVPLDFFGVAATLVAAGTAWVQFNQYRSLADLYGDMAFELAEFHRRCTAPAHAWTEQKWAAFVDAVESLLAAEHAAWHKLIDPDEGQAEPVPALASPPA